MWFEHLEEGASWAELWREYIRCGHCVAIRRVEGLCPCCGARIEQLEPNAGQLANGSDVPVRHTFLGGEGRYEDWVYLAMLEHEWKRPITDKDRFLEIAPGSRPSARLTLVVVFWSYFETKIDRLFREGLSDKIPAPVMEDLLQRYSGIGARLDRLYRIAFSATYWSDLEGLGFPQVSRILQRVHEKRNLFAHGHPEAIDDQLIVELVDTLRDEHEAWIAVFNKRATRCNANTS